MRSVLAAVGLIAGGVVGLAGGPFAASAGAQTDPAAGGDPEFIRGEAFATADSFTMALTSGGAEIGFSRGTAIARYQDASGQAEARALDLGVLSTLYGELSRCDDRPALFPDDSLPPITAVDSGSEAAGAPGAVSVQMPRLRGGLTDEVVGTQDATASDQPSSWAETTSNPIDLGVLKAVGARTTVATDLHMSGPSRGTRHAHAVSTIDQVIVLGGLMVLDDVRWEAEARSGATESTDGRFTVGRATVLGFDRTSHVNGDLAALSSFLEGLFGGFGVHFDVPRVEVVDGAVSVTPLAFRIVEAPFGKELVGPLLSWLQPQREALFADLVATDCTNASLVQTLDVVLQFLSGSGQVEISVGGVEASTDDTYYPPAVLSGPQAGADIAGSLPATGTDSGVPGPPSLPAVVTASPVDGLSSIGGGSGTALGDSAVAEGVDDDAPDDDAVGEFVEIALPASSTSTTTPGSTGGKAAGVGLGVLGLVLALVALDRRSIRRSTAVPAEAATP